MNGCKVLEYLVACCSMLRAHPEEFALDEIQKFYEKL